MTKEQLKTLAMLPQVIDALNALAQEQEQLRHALAKAGMGTPVAPTMTQAVSQPRPSAPIGTAYAPIAPNLPTPERAEYRSGNPPVSEEEAVGLNPESPQHLQDPRAARAAFLRQVRGGGSQRAEKLAQFRHDGNPGEEPQVVQTHQLELSGG